MQPKEENQTDIINNSVVDVNNSQELLLQQRILKKQKSCFIASIIILLLSLLVTLIGVVGFIFLTQCSNSGGCVYPVWVAVFYEVGLYVLLPIGLVTFVLNRIYKSKAKKYTKKHTL